MRTLLAWSSGKDSAWALHVLRQRPGVEVAGLLTTFDEGAGRVPVHGVPLPLVEAQARAVGLPLRPVPLPWPCPNADYEARTGEALSQARAEGVTHVAFGDLFLEDLRAYREALAAQVGLAALFPLWDPPGGTAALAREMLAGGLRAEVVAVDAERLPASLVGRPFDAALLDALPGGVDPCGEGGEFHTFCTDAPPFAAPVPLPRSASPPVLRDGLWTAPLAPPP